MIIQSMREVLLEIFGLQDLFDASDVHHLNNLGTGKYLVYMSDSQYAPPIDREDKTSTWIGYRFMEKTRYARAWTEQRGIIIYHAIPTQFVLRLAFVGKHAEELGDTTLTWDDRLDVQNAFEKRGFQLMYNKRSLYTYAVKQEGFNDINSWITEISGTGVVKIETNIRPWFTR